MDNLFSNLAQSLPSELVTILAVNQNVRIERIISTGHRSPDGFWYDQAENEWVVVLKGNAKLLLEGDDKPTTLGPGDFVNIPAHQRHRVESTDPDEPTVWLAVFYGANTSGSAAQLAQPFAYE